MRWHHMLPTALGLAWGQPPDLLVLHAGGNNLGRRSGKDLIDAILNNLQFRQKQHPDSVVVWLTIIPKRAWAARDNPQALNNEQRGVNQEFCHAILRADWTVIGHPTISASKPELFQPDIHLFDKGLDL
ncbi:hypothetical protein JRQ81_001996 [Phrynocephalus forsythii]|uniref:SGNH hydrolase-type esterase domain-containing protein n=1 Tax=Phrynocephalus forsythii TaxID=171643 RepID=A0A9Q0XH40_9SAUR|nr:hypothetical protein JRQ81_001996 [Phrynocephalus forsythii]